MDSSLQTSVTRLLGELQDGDRSVLDELFHLVYDALHALAKRQREGWHGDHTLNTTALVHEAYLKLVDQNRVQLNSRAHFLSVAAKAMRHILIDYARRRRAEKRGGDIARISLDEIKLAIDDQIDMTDERAEALVELDDALERLAEVEPREAQVVECRFFGGMTIAETAAALGISPMTVKRDWAMAQAWLVRALRDG